MAKQGLGKKGIERFKTRRLNRPKVDAKKKKSGPPQPQKGGVSKPQPQTKKKDNVKQRKRPVHVGAFGGGGQGLPHAYKPTQTILLVGEGNFSFTRALVRLFDGDGSNIVATAYDSEADVRQKYTDFDAEIKDEISDVRLLFDVDGTNLARCLKLNKRLKREAKESGRAPRSARGDGEGGGGAVAAARQAEAGDKDGDAVGDDDDEEVSGSGSDSGDSDEEEDEEEAAAAAGAAAPEKGEGGANSDSDDDDDDGSGEGEGGGGGGGGSSDSEDGEDDGSEDGSEDEGRKPPPPPRAGPKPLPTEFDRIVFNFPHRGLGIKDQDANVRANQQLLVGFFRSALELLAPGGEILLTVKTGMPYDLWSPVKMASGATGNQLLLRTALPFEPSKFPGYEHRRTIGFIDGLSVGSNADIQGKARTYIFQNAFDPHKSNKWKRGSAGGQGKKRKRSGGGGGGGGNGGGKKGRGGGGGGRGGGGKR